MALFIIMFLASPFITPYLETMNYLFQNLEQQQTLTQSNTITLILRSEFEPTWCSQTHNCDNNETTFKFTYIQCTPKRPQCTRIQANLDEKTLCLAQIIVS